MKQKPPSIILDLFIGMVELFKPYEPYLDLRENTAWHYEVWTNHGFRTKGMSPKTIKGLQFGAVILFQKYVGVYLHPMYLQEEIKTTLSHTMQSALRGRSCFHVTALTGDMHNEMKNVLRLCWKFYAKQRWVTRRFP